MILTIPGTKITCDPHATLKQCKGVVFSRDVIRYSEEKLVHELGSQGVMMVERLH